MDERGSKRRRRELQYLDTQNIIDKKADAREGLRDRRTRGHLQQIADGL